MLGQPVSGQYIRITSDLVLCTCGQPNLFPEKYGYLHLARCAHCNLQLTERIRDEEQFCSVSIYRAGIVKPVCVRTRTETKEYLSFLRNYYNK